jgi:hypothetical protein
MLEMSTADFGNSLKITSDNGMVTFLAELQEIVEKIRTDTGFAGAPLSAEQQPAILVKKMMLAIFAYLKTTIESTLKPQKQLTIRIGQESLDLLEGFDLPPDARLIPVGSGSPIALSLLPVPSTSTVSGNLIFLWSKRWNEVISATDRLHCC